MDKLVENALNAMNNSYSPYSNFKVGAALELKNGEIIKGTNVENASFGATSCAERNAIFSAISQGYKKEDFKRLAVAADTNGPVSPCGICRQVISEFLDYDDEVILANTKGDVLNTSVKELLPFSFTGDELE